MLLSGKKANRSLGIEGSNQKTDRHSDYMEELNGK